MKKCPTCQRDYFDDTLDFCLEDGTKLSTLERDTNEVLTATSINPKFDLTSDKTVELPLEKSQLNSPAAPIFEKKLSEKTQVLRENVAHTSNKFLELTPIVIALAHNYWQWLYLFRKPTFQLWEFFSSYNFLIWMFLLVTGLLFSFFSVKYGKNKGFAVVALVVLAINVILSVVPKQF